MLFPPRCCSPGLLHWCTYRCPLNSSSDVICEASVNFCHGNKVYCTPFCIPIVLSKFPGCPLAQLSSEWQKKEWMNKSALWLIMFLTSLLLELNTQLDLNLRCMHRALSIFVIQIIVPHFMKHFHALPIALEQVLANISYLSATLIIADLLAIAYTSHTYEPDHLHAFRLTESCLDCVFIGHCYLLDVYKLEILSVCLFHMYHIQYHIYYI